MIFCVLCDTWYALLACDTDDRKRACHRFARFEISVPVSAHISIVRPTLPTHYSSRQLGGSVICVLHGVLSPLVHCCYLAPPAPQLPPVRTTRERTGFLLH